MQHCFFAKTPLAICAILFLLTLGGCASTHPVSKFDPRPQRASEGSEYIAAGKKPVLPIPSPATVALFDAANEALQSHDLERAETLYQELLETEPGFPNAYMNLAVVFAMTGRTGDAIALLDQVIALAPAECRAYLHRARLQRDQFQFEASEASLLACTTEDPDFAEAYLGLGVLYELYMGRLLAARTAYERYQALSAVPDERVSVWIGELNRRIDASQQLAAGEH